MKKVIDMISDAQADKWTPKIWGNLYRFNFFNLQNHLKKQETELGVQHNLVGVNLSPNKLTS